MRKDYTPPGMRLKSPGHVPPEPPQDFNAIEARADIAEASLAAAEARIAELTAERDEARRRYGLAVEQFLAEREVAEAQITALRAALSSSGVIDATQAWLDQRDAALASSPPSGTVPTPPRGSDGSSDQGAAEKASGDMGSVGQAVAGGTEGNSRQLPQATPPSAEAAGVPDWQLVPKEPNEAMSNAAAETLGQMSYADVYRAMLAAAPSPPSEPTVLTAPDAARLKEAEWLLSQIKGWEKRDAFRHNEAWLIRLDKFNGGTAALMGRKPAPVEPETEPQRGRSPGIEGA